MSSTVRPSPKPHMPLPASPEALPVSVQSLGSGSSGNAFLIQRGEQLLLLDCGVGIRTIRQALTARNRRLDGIDAVLLTHEHIDHVRTIPQVLDSKTPVIATRGTLDRLRIAEPQWRPIQASQPIEINGIRLWALPVDHDANEPCGYLIEMPETTVTIITDLGAWHQRLEGAVAASDLVILEANHDEEMLRRGPYPPHLKRRVGSAIGHLSNHDCGSALAGIAKGGRAAPVVWLAHLSETNNRPTLAEATVREALARNDVELPVTALPRREPGPVWTPGPPAKPTPAGGYRPYEEPPPRATGPTQLGLDALAGF
ncbi:MAG: MBL fold metallo-hydrolase [Chloroflexia bacterium]|nr:MBL fold metallo-hydrolase [Chloroflexia bacterium]